MLRKALHIGLVLGICALLLPTTGSAKQRVERPYRIHGNMTIVLDLTDMTWDMEDWGEATHMGRYANEGFGVVEDIYLLNGSGEGVNIVANGEKVLWEMTAVNGTWTIFITGGTGRFENATGSMIVAPGTPVVTPGPGPTQLTYTMTYTASGTITY